MKVIYWRWKNKKFTPISKDYIQKISKDIIEVRNTTFWTDYPTRLLKKEIEIIKITKESEA
jgi:hypothetical protein